MVRASPQRFLAFRSVVFFHESKTRFGMPRNYLFGPVSPAFAEQNLHRQRKIRKCVAFNAVGTADLAIQMTDSWEAVYARLASGWQPDMVILYLPYTTIPACLWSAPVPVIGLAADWNLLWHWYRQQSDACDLILTDTGGVEALTRTGIGHGCAANLFGSERSFLEQPLSGDLRDIDVLFVGNLNAAVQRERLSWLGRVARLSERWRVVIDQGVFGEEYRQLLGRSRIVFNRSIRGEANKRAFEAAGAGALLFQEAENHELSAYFQGTYQFVLRGEYVTVEILVPLKYMFKDRIIVSLPVQDSPEPCELAPMIRFPGLEIHG
jgi:hypothetical protein